ncbi:hypothetical protein G9U51_11115 [Calidifontibacter sp. DB0510]|uniref:Esterase n=1 Tax=Metallococcus carri TaxID=1656884 RepID=A0A967EF57_9MICO|nr:alpha/beta hydrolase-fold protein [Metallococcus carri]NHN56326.1 hypothetical protein [Metallococcus carri]NOP35950.1 hypothetical protein [Calidifontibacter sp. DB2511S]
MYLRLGDRERRYDAVALEADVSAGPCRLERRGWTREVGTQGLWRLEYRFLVTRRRRVRQEPILDPRCPDTVDTEWGTKSEWRRSDYREPDWLTAPTVAGRTRPLDLPTAYRIPMKTRLWAPAGLRAADPAPLLVCHDGDHYERYAAITQWAGAHIAAGVLPPFRLLLADAHRRNSWYSASPVYARSFTKALDELETRYAVRGWVAVMGASLGGLAALHAGVRDERVGVVFSQSGSFFDPWISQEDNGFRDFDRIADEVRELKRMRPPRRLEVGLSCGMRESNFDLNESLERMMADHGWRTVFTGFPDLHNYTAWRDNLDPVLPSLLRRAWGM